MTRLKKIFRNWSTNRTIAETTMPGWDASFDRRRERCYDLGLVSDFIQSSKLWSNGVTKDVSCLRFHRCYDSMMPWSAVFSGLLRGNKACRFKAGVCPPVPHIPVGFECWPMSFKQTLQIFWNQVFILPNVLKTKSLLCTKNSLSYRF